MLLIMSIIFTVAMVVFAALYILIDSIDFFDALIVAAVLTFFMWFAFFVIRKSVPKNAETYFKYHNVDGLVEFCYELRETEFVVTQPTIGNVSHFKYEMITKVIDLGGYAVVMLAPNQFLPIIDGSDTAQLISTLKSVSANK